MIFVFSLLAIKVAFGALSMNCPKEQLHFEKIIGLRPSHDVPAFLLYKNENKGPITNECLQKCMNNDDCVSFVLYFNISECYWFTSRFEGLQEYEHVIDSEVAWFQKTCLNVTNCTKSWIFERIPGAILVGNNLRTLPNKVSRTECQQNCLNDSANCRSAKFRIFDEPNSTETLGTCTLSDTDRHLLPNSYRVSSYNEEYFENQCSDASTNEFCAFEEYENAILTHVDEEYENKSKNECETLCEKTTKFNCRGYSLIPSNDNNNVENANRVDDQYKCLIHSEDSKIHGPRLLQMVRGGKFYERARCLNITVSCTETHITINYQPEVKFTGKIYMVGYSEHLECYVLGRGTEMVRLKMPLFENQCGISEAKSPDYLNRTLLSGTMLLQYNPLIQTQGDRLIKVGCIFVNESKIVLGTGVNFTNFAYANGGTTILNSTTMMHPIVEMRVVDFYTQEEVSDTQIGQELQLVIEINPPNGPYDIWAGHLIAMTDDGSDSILLLDDRGCPTNLNIFPRLIKVANNETHKLIGNFQAFKFSSSPVVRFSVIVQFCPIYCTPVNCNNVTSTSKRKKRDLDTISDTGTTIKQINKQQYDDQGKNVTKMPLEIILVVRNSKVSSDRLIYGENKVLVAGYDLATNEVCFDYSLLIGIIITWVLTQIILITCGLLLIRHYKRYYDEQSTTQSLEELHKNFGLGFSNLEPRRVHWADNGDFT